MMDSQYHAPSHAITYSGAIFSIPQRIFPPSPCWAPNLLNWQKPSRMGMCTSCRLCPSGSLVEGRIEPMIVVRRGGGGVNHAPQHPNTSSHTRHLSHHATKSTWWLLLCFPVMTTHPCDSAIILSILAGRSSFHDAVISSSSSMVPTGTSLR